MIWDLKNNNAKYKINILGLAFTAINWCNEQRFKLCLQLSRFIEKTKYKMELSGIVVRNFELVRELQNY